MLRFLRLLLGLEHPSRRELMATRDAVDGLEARVDRHYDELRALAGRVNAYKRWEKAREDAPESTNGEEEEPEGAPVKSASSAHLARRFRGF